MALLTGRRSPARPLAAAIFAACVSASHLFSQAAAPPAAAPPLEAQVKAAFLYNFAKFIDWPASTSSPKEEVFVIGVLGETPIFAALSALEGQDVKGRRLVIRRFQRVSDVVCHVLFVSADQTPAFSTGAAALSNQPILTVGEGDEFLKAGGMIALVRTEGKIRYRVRPRQAEIARLVISSKLLKLADRTGE